MKTENKSWEALYKRKKGQLGSGGNATVFRVQKKDTEEECALKELTEKCKAEREKKDRFQDEIDIMSKYGNDIPGILPVLDYNREACWYTMPIAEKIVDHVGKKGSLNDIVRGFIQLTETLELLHDLGVSHRDIKPQNIYYYQDRYTLGDFGIADFPDKLDSHTGGKALGAIYTIAPEMKRDPSTADGRKADVYSLAKTLWMLITGDVKGFEGTYNFQDESHGLRFLKQYRDKYLVEIEALLKDATQNTPDLRPSMTEFGARLKAWLEISSDLLRSQANEWRFLEQVLFGQYPPESSQWSDPQVVVELLNLMGRSPAYNHMMLPDGGGMDFERAELAAEKGCIYLYAEPNDCYLVKPKCLIYENFGENYRWNYFLLEIEALKPVLAEDTCAAFENLVEDAPGHYVDSTDAVYGVYDYDTGEPLPQGSKTVRRYLKGKFLIVMKLGPYNHIARTYDGRHARYGSTVFREYIQTMAEEYAAIYRSIHEDERFREYDAQELERVIAEYVARLKDPQRDAEMEAKDTEQFLAGEAAKEYLSENYASLHFSEMFEEENPGTAKACYCFRFRLERIIDLADVDLINERRGLYVCRDGTIQGQITPQPDQCWVVYDRERAVKLRERFMNTVNQYLGEHGHCELGYNCFSIELIRIGNPEHLFTKEEIETEMRRADDRKSNQLVIDENGYARVIPDEGWGKLYPVRHETWHARNCYVGKYSGLTTLDDDYMASLECWLLYLQAGEPQYADYDRGERNEEELLREIKECMANPYSRRRAVQFANEPPIKGVLEGDKERRRKI